MRLLFGLLVAGALSNLFAQKTPLSSLPYTPSLEPAFMDKGADPCVDFYRYSCGNWNKLNPIPADQASWSVYAKMEDDNQRFLWGILQQAGKPSAARNANEQKIGDYFNACMDEAAVERTGSKPLEPSLSKIANLKSPEAIADYVAGQHRSGIDRNVLFAFGSEQDYDNSSQMMAFAFAGGLGLPDRDYYTKTDAKSQEIRERYVQHIGKMFVLLGESAPNARSDAQAVMQIETALATVSLTRTDKRNPYNLKHKVSREELMHMVPAFDWDAYFNALGAPEFSTVNVTEPKFFGELNTQLHDRKLADWRAYLRWHLLHSEAELLSSAFEKENFAFFDQYLAGLERDASALEEVYPAGRRSTRGRSRSGICRQNLLAADENRCAESHPAD